MSKEKEEQTLEYGLGMQLGSDFDTLAEARVDTQRVTRISPIEAFVYSHFLQIPSYRGGNYAGRFVGNKLNLNMSVEGWRANQIIKAIAGSKGVPMQEFVRRPGWFGRNVSQRDWEKRAAMEGKDVIE